jgi:hypothetical protein
MKMSDTERSITISIIVGLGLIALIYGVVYVVTIRSM